MGLRLVVDPRGVLAEKGVVAPAGGLLEQVDGLGTVHVVLASGPGLVGAGAVQRDVAGQAQGIEGFGVIAFGHGLEGFQADAAHPGDG